MLRVAIFIVGVLCGLAPQVQAGNIPLRRLAHLVEEPYLVVGRIAAVQVDALPFGVPRGVTGATATVEVLRRYASEETLAPESASRLQLRFSTSVGGGAGGPMYPVVQPGEVYVFPLRSQSDAGL